MTQRKFNKQSIDGENTNKHPFYLPNSCTKKLTMVVWQPVHRFVQIIAQSYSLCSFPSLPRVTPLIGEMLVVSVYTEPHLWFIIWPNRVIIELLVSLIVSLREWSTWGLYKIWDTCRNHAKLTVAVWFVQWRHDCSYSEPCMHCAGVCIKRSPCPLASLAIDVFSSCWDKLENGQPQVVGTCSGPVQTSLLLILQVKLCWLSVYVWITSILA